MLHPFSHSFLHRLSSGVLSTSCVLALTAQGAIAQSEPAEPAEPAAPTVRYARGEDVDIAEIVKEWRGYYADVPVYLCTCQEASCNQTQQWPYRVFDRYQMSVALGPTNGVIAEDSGSNCFDIADGSRPSEPRAFSAEETTIAESPRPTITQPDLPASNRPTPDPVTPPPANRPVAAPAESPAQAVATGPSASGIPVATVINQGADIQLDWPSGSSNVVNVADSTWNLSVLDAIECENLTQVDQKILEAKRVVATPVVDETTGNIAVPVLLDSCVDTDQSAVFILDPTEGGGYALYRTQLPGVGTASQSENRTLPNEFASYPFSSITGLRYWNGSLFVRHGTASGAEAVMIFRPDQTPSGTYAGCGVISANEGADRLCSE